MEIPVWKYLCGNTCVEIPVWKYLCGNTHLLQLSPEEVVFDGVKSFSEIYQYRVQRFFQLLGSLGECTQNKKVINSAVSFPKTKLSV